MNLARLVSLSGLCAINGADGQPLFRESTTRGWMERNLRGFRDKCVVKVGGRSMVDLDALDRWLEDGRGGKVERKPAEQPPSRQARQRRDYDEVLREAGIA